ncbi:hypothetical protein GN956_G15504 [Arapaima gigas]
MGDSTFSFLFRFHLSPVFSSSPEGCREANCQIRRPLSLQCLLCMLCMEERGSLVQNTDKQLQVGTPMQVAFKVFMTALPIAQITMDDCPLQSYIPLYLLVSGTFGLLFGLVSCLPCSRGEEDGGWTALGSFCTALNSLLVAFLFCWFITGNVWIFSIYPPNYDSTIPQEPYCDRSLYLFAFWTTAAVYVLLGALLLTCVCVFICIWICGRKEPIRGLTWNI